MRTSLTEHRHIVLYVLAVAGLLLIPVGLMAVSDSVKWSAFDFIVAGVLLLGTGLAFELVSRRTGNPTYRTVTGVVLVGLLLLIWAEEAISLFN